MTTDGVPVGTGEFRSALSHLASGVTVITTPATATTDAGAMTATAFCSVSLDPPLVLVSVGRASRFHPALLSAEGWAVSLLAAGQRHVAEHFSDPGRQLSTQFAGVATTPSPHAGAPVVAGALAWLECRTVARHEAGDHTLVIGLVLAVGEATETVAPLTYHRGLYRNP